MKLHVMDRLALLSLLPREGDFTTLKMVRQLRERLADYTERERKALAFSVQEQDGKPFTQWNSAADKGWEFAFVPTELGLIVDALKKANTQKKLAEVHLNVYEMFVESSSGNGRKLPPSS